MYLLLPISLSVVVVNVVLLDIDDSGDIGCPNIDVIDSFFVIICCDLHNNEQRSHKPLRYGLAEQPLVVIVIKLCPTNHVND